MTHSMFIAERSIVFEEEEEDNEEDTMSGVEKVND